MTISSINGRQVTKTRFTISWMEKIFKFILLSTFFIFSNSSRIPCTKTDAEALILFKNSIPKDPNLVLSNWQAKNSPCIWFGVWCNNANRVVHLSLSNLNLSGNVSFYSFASLNKLIFLDLSHNHFSINSSSLLHLPNSLYQLNLSHNNVSGYLPELFLTNFQSLQSLDVSYNNLSGSLQFPNSCSNLTYLDVSMNHLTGIIPENISSCLNLKSLNLSYNSFAGEIPQSISNLHMLEKLDLSNNHIEGPIPYTLSSACGSLLELRLSSNNISGSIPSSFFSCMNLQLLDISNNYLSGPLQNNVLKGLSSLQILKLNNNYISGEFPSLIFSMKNLKLVDLSSNKLSKHLPLQICQGETSLEELRIPDNLITGQIPPQLSNCSNLRTIDISVNNLHGPIPKEFGSLEKLEQLMLWFNGINGEIPSELGQCKNLKNLIVNNNLISGKIPKGLSNCSNLEWISLTSNMISGVIPSGFGRLSRLAVLQLANNSISGEIPKELSNCSSLVWLDLNSNRLTGKIPKRIGRHIGSETSFGILSGNTLAFVRNVGNSCKGVGGLLEFAGIRPERLLEVPTLKSCDFTRLYSGTALSDWTRYQTIEYLDLSYNNLHGGIPVEFGNMTALQVLDVAHNKLTEQIPETLGQLRNLGVFDASHNLLSGRIPDSFSYLSFLVQIDLSNNNLTGSIPSLGQLSTLPASQYANNPGLCGVPLPPCHTTSSSYNDYSTSKGTLANSAAHWPNYAVGVLVSVVMFLCAAVLWTVAIYARRKEIAKGKMLDSLQAAQAATLWKIGKEKKEAVLSINVATFQRQLKKLTFSQLIEATNGFSSGTLIGTGGFGEVFKATLKDGTTVAIKKLINLSYQGDREFVAEMETLGKIKHNNLVPLLGYCKIGEERLLVYRYMKHGSLEGILHGKQGRILNWYERKRIARGAAKGLCFLHHNCIPHIIHRDMKSSNVLLDEEMEARVSDFGMARLISAVDTHLSVSTLAGTPGYVPPEYYQSFRCTAKGDVYSFGVVMLEILTGRRPTDKEEFEDTNLVGWVKMKAKRGEEMEIVDEGLVMDGSEEEIEEMKRFLELSLKCVDDSPARRPSMVQVVACLREFNSTVL